METSGEEFLQTAKQILAGGDVSKSQYNICLAIAAGRVLYSNAQRPAAVTGALLSEYLEAFKAQKGRPLCNGQGACPQDRK